MAIRDCSNLPDYLIPEWVKHSRERSREIARRRQKFLKEQADKQSLSEPVRPL